MQKDANANFDKATTMMMLLAKEKTPNLEVELKKNLTNWFIYRAGGGGLYTVDPKNEPLRANRILANENHHNYPKPTDFLIELKANVSKRASEGELARKDASFLFDVMDHLEVEMCDFCLTLAKKLWIKEWLCIPFSGC